MKRITTLSILALLTSGSVMAQADDRAVGRFSSDSKPRVIVVEAPGAAMLVEGYSGSEVVAEARLLEDDEPNGSGLRRIRTTGLRIEESDNVMHIHVGTADMELHLQVPVQTSLRLKGHYAGPIEVRGVRGDHEISNFSKDVILTNVSGSAIVSAWSGDIRITFAHVDPDKPMSFATQSGDIDVTFPSTWMATLNTGSQFGEIYVDSDIRSRGSEGTRRSGVNEVGADVRLKTFSGDIYVRRAK